LTIVTGPAANHRRDLTRRRMLGLGLASLGAMIACSCADLTRESFGVADSSETTDGRGETAQQGRLQTRPSPPTENGPVGLHPLGLDDQRDGLLYVPIGYRPDQPAPLALALHGANGAPQRGLNPLQSLADETGVLLLAPASRGRTWDIVLGGYGPDVAFIDRALAWTFERYAVDPTHLAVSGFSDGASYALSIGAANGDLFTHILAFSPGFADLTTRRGSPRLYVSHGTEDEILPIDMCSRRMVPAFRRAGYDVRYDEFDGPHAVPPTIARAALDWFLAG
jgi:predicted esterase